MADPALLVDDTVTCVVQVQGKVRDRIEVPPTIGDDELRAAGAGQPEGRARRWTAGASARSIVRAPKLVNVVAGVSRAPR